MLGGLLAQLRSIATAGTRLAISAGIPGADPARREKFAARVAGLGEPVALAGTEARAAARWRAVELSERSQRAGMLVGAPVWEPGAPPTAARVGRYLERIFHRGGMDGLAKHLAGAYGSAVTGIRRLDVGVVRVDRADGPPWATRIFPAARPLGVTRGDSEILRYLADAGYPAERLADPEAVSEHEGQAVLVTEFLHGKAPSTQAIFKQLGEAGATAHAARPAPAAGRRLAPPRVRGRPDAEIAALRTLLDARPHVADARPHVAAERRPALAAAGGGRAARRSARPAARVHAPGLRERQRDRRARRSPGDHRLGRGRRRAATVDARFLLWSAGLSGPT